MGRIFKFKGWTGLIYAKGDVVEKCRKQMSCALIYDHITCQTIIAVQPVAEGKEDRLQECALIFQEKCGAEIVRLEAYPHGVHIREDTHGQN